MKKNRLAHTILYFYTFSIIALIVGFIIKGESSYIYNTLALYLSYLFIVYYEQKRNLSISNTSKILIIITAISHLALGQYYALYDKTIFFDKALHLFGSFSAAIFLYEIVVSLSRVDLDSELLIFAIVFSIGITAGVFLETLEFILDIVFDSNNQHGLNDTSLDLIFNIIGCYIAGYIILYKYSFQ